MRRLGWVGLALLGLWGGAAAAQGFGDCTDPSYLRAFPSAPTAEDLICVELFRFSISTPDGPREIRGIADAAGDWAAPPALVAEVERGARLAANAFALLGRYKIDNVTLLIIDDVYETSEITNHGTGGEVFGAALSDRELRPGESQECLVAIYSLAAGVTDGSMATTVAHELFHCIQGATYPGDKYASYGDGGAWWIEGAAEAFAAAAIPESARFTDRSEDFDASVEARYALDRMLHQSVHFFYWLMQTDGGLSALMPFQDRMAETGGREAQWAAMREAMDPERWQAFAEAYADSRIFHPQGGTLASSPPEGTLMTFDDSGRQTLPLEPFAISLGQATYGCGVWGNTAAPDAPQMTWKPEDAGSTDDWRPLPEELDTREGRDTVWRFVTMPVDESLAEGEVTAERRQGCTPCMGTSAIDACLVGTWAMTGGGPAEWMRAQGFPGTVDTSGGEQIVLRPEGIFVTGAFGVSLDVDGNGVLFAADGVVPAAVGAWSAEGGVVNFCAGAGGGLIASISVTTSEGVTRGPMGAPGGGSISMRYSCSGGSLTTALEMPGFPDMETYYSKVAE